MMDWKKQILPNTTKSLEWLYDCPNPNQIRPEQFLKFVFPNYPYKRSHVGGSLQATLYI